MLFDYHSSFPSFYFLISPPFPLSLSSSLPPPPSSPSSLTHTCMGLHCHTTKQNLSSLPSCFMCFSLHEHHVTVILPWPLPWPSHNLHITFTWLSHDCHMTVTWLSHDCHMTVTWPHSPSHWVLHSVPSVSWRWSRTWSISWTVSPSLEVTYASLHLPPAVKREGERRRRRRKRGGEREE